MVNEMNCKPGDMIKWHGMKFVVKEVLYSYRMGDGSVGIEFIGTDNEYHYYKQEYDGGEYIRAPKTFKDSYGTDCTDIFKKYGYC